MNFSEFKEQIDFWETWAKNGSEDYKPYDLALFKIFSVFERYISDLFIEYLLGNKSEFGLKPKNKLTFTDMEQIEKVFTKNNKFVDYLDCIENISPALFDDNPFHPIIDTVPYRAVYCNCRAIRNFVAHDSIESKRKYIKNICGGEAEKFIEPCVHLSNCIKNSEKSYFEHYIESLVNIAELASGK